MKVYTIPLNVQRNREGKEVSYLFFGLSVVICIVGALSFGYLCLASIDFNFRKN